MNRSRLLPATLALTLPALVIAAEQPIEQTQPTASTATKNPVKKEPEVLVTPTLKVEGTERLLPYAGGLVLDHGYIQSTNKGNGDLATILRVNPAVQFADTATNSSRRQGEIRPADFSINGAPPWQNLLLLDGMSFNNDIEPAGNASGNPNVTDAVPAPIQGIALDTDLIGSLTVHDANVPAAFGGFTGGVVDVETRQARAAFGGKVSFRMARSAWDEMIIPEDNRDIFEISSTIANQPRYDKYHVGLMLEGRTRQDIGLIGNISHTHSDIPLRGYSAGNISSEDDFIKTMTRENTSISLRADASPTSKVRISANFTHTPTDERYFIQNAKNSWFDLKQGGPMAGIRLSYLGDAWTFKHSLNYSNLDSSRRSDSGLNYWKTWQRSEAFAWGVGANSFEGNWGSIDQATRNLAYKLSADRAGLALGATTHHLQWGLEYRDRKAYYHRIADHYSYINTRPTTSCIGPDGVEDTEACSLSPVFATGRGQFMTRLTVWSAGEFEVKVREMAAFVQDAVQFGRWNLRAGLRFDHDNMMDKNTIAPRLALSWDVLGNQKTLLTTGANRYYGRNFFGYKLREGRERLQTVYLRSSVAQGWGPPDRALAANRFETLNIPYADEWLLGVARHWAGLDLNAKYVRREGRDELLREQIVSNDDSGFYKDRVYRYVNKGRSRSQTYSIFVNLRQPWQWGPVNTQMQFGLDHTDVRRNHTDYNDDFNARYDRLIRYNGSIMRANELPQRGYNRPWTARLSTQTRFETLGLLWSNFWRWRDGYISYVTIDREVYQDGSLTTIVDVIESRENPSSWSWDSTLEYNFRLPGKQQMYARVEVQNILNRATRMTNNTISATALYEPGRSYWLELGYRF